MTILHTIILGIVEGITEFLPISSTGHLIIASHALQLPVTEFQKSFEIIIQLGAILAVVVLYFKKIMSSRTLWLKVLAGFVPTAIIGYILYKLIKQYLLGNLWVVAIALIVGGIVMIILEKRKKPKDYVIEKPVDEIGYRQAIIIGCVQSLAVIPGVSRSAATIFGGLAQNISRAAIVEFSFLLAVPVIAAASFLDIIKTGISFTGHEWVLLAVGLIVSFLVAIASIKYFLKFITNHTFEWFGWYRIALGIVVILMIVLV